MSYSIGFNRDWGAYPMLRILSHLILGIFTLPHIISATFRGPQCTSGIPHTSIGQEWVYTAPPAFVPAPPVDPTLQMEFFQLFMSYSNQTRFAMRGQPIPPGLSQNDLEFIASVCPKDAFFYSMSPQHVQARLMLQRYLALLPTPREVIRVARIILYTAEINPKIWYYALMGAVMERPDMSGMQVPQPLDVIPDLFVPAPILNEVLSRYKFVVGLGSGPLLPGPIQGPGSLRGPPIAPIPPRGLLSSIGPDDSYSYQHVSQASEVFENRIKFDRSLKTEATSLSNVTRSLAKAQSKSVRPGRSDININGEFGKRTVVRYRRVKKNRKSQRDVASHEDDHDHDVDSAPAESITSHSVVKLNLNDVTTSISSITSTTTTPEPKSVSYRSSHELLEGPRLSYGEEDDEFDELKRIHDTGSNSTKQITQRILLRRQRLKKKKKTKVKRQVFGSPFLNPSPPIRDCVIINGTVGASNGLENKLWYWREDLMLNQHHWFWHQMYPVNVTTSRHGDRRGELFYFTHRNLVARYNAERLSNGLPRTVELLLKHGSYIEDGYDSFLVDANSGKLWTPRQPHAPLTDILHTEDPDFARDIFLKDMEDLYYKLVFSIKDGHLAGPGHGAIPLQTYRGIDGLANTIEATQLSLNPFYYDAFGIHNLGHQLLGLVQDPQFISRVPTGVMADTTVTMRDPVFYTFHSGIDNIFDKYKRTLPPYQLYEGDFPLVWPGIAISSVIVAPALNDGHNNRIRTFWTTDRFPLESGIDNSIHNGQVKEDICALHLNHEPFTYKITVNVNPCVKSVSSQGTVRIFMAPRYDEFGHRFPLKVQRRLMFQLDSFPAQLRSGLNVIIRRSTDSSLTKQWALSLRDMAYQSGVQKGAQDCGCGFPLHLNIPKGTPQGMHFDLFVMITNFDQDFVEDSIEDLKIPEGCRSPFLMCGRPWRRYPDTRPMGYPFDRLPYKIPASCRTTTGFPDVFCKMMPEYGYKSPESLEEYVRPVPNMAATVVNIQHIDTIVN